MRIRNTACVGHCGPKQSDVIITTNILANPVQQINVLLRMRTRVAFVRGRAFRSDFLLIIVIVISLKRFKKSKLQKFDSGPSLKSLAPCGSCSATLMLTYCTLVQQILSKLTIQIFLFSKTKLCNTGNQLMDSVDLFFLEFLSQSLLILMILQKF